jgi:hypothetical protein
MERTPIRKILMIINFFIINVLAQTAIRPTTETAQQKYIKYHKVKQRDKEQKKKKSHL